MGHATDRRWIIAVVLIGAFSPWLARPVDRWLYDAVMAARPRRALPSDFLLVDVTASRNATLDKQSMAYLIDRLTSAGARVIVADMLLPAVLGPDKALDNFYAAVARSAGVVWASQLIREGAKIVGHRPPIEALHARELGFAEFLEDEDRVVRRALLYVQVPGRGTFTSLAMSAWLVWRHASSPGSPTPEESRAAMGGGTSDQVPISNDAGRIFIDTSWVPRDETGRGPGVVKLADLVAIGPGGQARSETPLLASLPLAGRVAFLAQISPAEGGDVFTVPGPGQGNKQVLPGFLIHASILASLMTGRGLRSVPSAEASLLAVLLALLGGVLARRGSPSRGMAFELGSAIAVATASEATLATFGLVLPSVGLGLALWLGGQAARRIGWRAEGEDDPWVSGGAQPRPLASARTPIADGTNAPAQVPPSPAPPGVQSATGVSTSGALRATLAAAMRPGADGMARTSPHLDAPGSPLDATALPGDTAVPPPAMGLGDAVVIDRGATGDDSRPPLSGHERVARLATGGRYVDLRPLAEGGMGSLYIAHDTRVGRPVVIKFLTAELKARGGTIADRFAREIALLVKLEGAGLPLVLDRHAQGPEPFVVMEKIDGETLSERLERAGPYAPDEVLRLAGEMAAMMVQVHHHGVIHRDLKLNNLMVDATGRLRLLDLGLAHSEEELPGLTQMGQIMGTPGYMPPEQERGDPVDGRADIYSFGVMLYEMLSGVLPLGRGHKSLVDFHAYPPPVCLLRPDTPLELVELVTRCLAPRAEDRPATFGALQRTIARHSARASGEGDAELWTLVHELVRAYGDDPSIAPADASAQAADLLARARLLDPTVLTDGDRRTRVTARLASVLARARSAGRSPSGSMRRRMDRIVALGSVQVAACSNDAWSTGRSGAPLQVDESARAVVWVSSFPATVTALLQSIMRQLGTGDPDALPRGATVRLTTTAAGPAQPLAFQVAATATHPVPAATLERWRARLLPPLYWLGGRLEAMEPTRTVVRLPSGFIRPSAPQASTRI